jgi:cytidylate kinase
VPPALGSPLGVALRPRLPDGSLLLGRHGAAHDHGGQKPDQQRKPEPAHRPSVPAGHPRPSVIGNMIVILRAILEHDRPAPDVPASRDMDRASTRRTDMGAQVITIAMTTGAGAEETGRLVAEQLGFQYVNDQIIDRAAQHAGVASAEVADVERSPSVISRIMNMLAAGVASEHVGASLAPEELDPSPSYRRLIQDVIREVASEGDVVILAHGASMLLAGTPGVLRVLVTASPGTRSARIAAASGYDERRAAREVQRTDGERRAFFRRFYDLDEELPTHYDLVVNTDELSPEVAARVIVYAARAQ